MTTVLIVLFDDDDGDAQAILAALSNGGLDYAVRRAETQAELCAWIADGPVDLVIAADVPALSNLIEMGGKVRPEVPFVVVANTPNVENAVDLLRHGAANYVPRERLDRLARAVSAALQEGAARKARMREEAERVRQHKELVDANRRRDAFLARVGTSSHAPERVGRMDEHAQDASSRRGRTGACACDDRAGGPDPSPDY